MARKHREKAKRMRAMSLLARAAHGTVSVLDGAQNIGFCNLPEPNGTKATRKTLRTLRVLDDWVISY
jgi:hypothetical protein